MIQGLDEEWEAKVDPESVRVVLFGPLPILETLLDEEVNVTVDLFGLISGTYSLEPDVSFPDRGIELRSIQPSQVTVEITRPLTITNQISRTLPIPGKTSFSSPLTGGTAGGSSDNFPSYFISPQAAVLPGFYPFSKRVYP
jgi:hypothetical protein